MLRPPSSLRPHTLGGRFRLLSAPLPRRETEVPTPTCPTSAMGSPVGGSDKPAVDEEADSCQHQEQENANDHPANHCHVARSFRGCEEGQLVTREPPHSPPGPHHPGYLWAPRHKQGCPRPWLTGRGAFLCSFIYFLLQGCPNCSVSGHWPGPHPGPELTQRLELVHLAASTLALLRQRLHLDQVGGVWSQVFQGHGETLSAAHIVAVGVPLWVASGWTMRAGQEQQLSPPETTSRFAR